MPQQKRITDEIKIHVQFKVFEEAFFCIDYLVYFILFFVCENLKCFITFLLTLYQQQNFSVLKIGNIKRREI